MAASVWARRRSDGSPERQNDARPAYERDRSRLLHAGGFRRLQGKTQVLGLGESDFHRSRLTHSLEVAQIARGLVMHLRKEAHDDLASDEKDADLLPSLPLIEAISLAHDIGHPPHGHSGEIALNYVMHAHGGFEGNAQSLRLLARLDPYLDGYGLDLARRTLLGILKYPAPYSAVRRAEWPDPPSADHEMNRKNWTPPKCYYDAEQPIVDWLLAPFTAKDRERFQSLKEKPTASGNGKTRYKSLDATIMDVADDIAYGVHDLEDAITLKLIDQQGLFEAAKEAFEPAWGQRVGIDNLESLIEQLFSTGPRKQAVGQLVHAFVLSVGLEAHGQFESPLLDCCARLSAPAATFLKALDRHKFKHVINRAAAQQMEYRGRLLIARLFKALASDPEGLLKPWYWKQYKDAESEQAKRRVICDYVAGMTDAYATEVYERLYVPGSGRVSMAR
jgi:dGTPase